MLMKIVIVALLVVILYCLGSALFFMLGKKSTPESMAKALTWRVSISLALFILLILGYYFGWITPN